MGAGTGAYAIELYRRKKCGSRGSGERTMSWGLRSHQQRSQCRMNFCNRRCFDMRKPACFPVRIRHNGTAVVTGHAPFGQSVMTEILKIHHRPRRRTPVLATVTHQEPSPSKRLDSYAPQHLGTARIIRLIAACRIDGAQKVGLTPDADSETFSGRSATPLFWCQYSLAGTPAKSVSTITAEPEGRCKHSVVGSARYSFSTAHLLTASEAIELTHAR